MDTLFINQGLKKYINCTQKTNCKNKLTNSNEETNDLCLKCKQIKIKNKKDRLHELLTVDFARYNRANNGDKMNTQFNNENFEQNNSFNTQKCYSCSKVSVNNKNKSNATYKKQHNAFQSTILLLSWLLVFVISAILVGFINYPLQIKNNLNTQSSVIAEGTKPSGSGVENDPYLISNSDEFRFIATTTDYTTYWGSSGNLIYYKVTNDFAVANDNWVSIGNNANRFYGYFDGDGHTIVIQGETTNYVLVYECGLFGYVAEGEIKNICVKWEDYGFYQVESGGGIVGYLGSSAKVTNCCNDSTMTPNTIQPSKYYVGGIVGRNYGTVTNCYNMGSITVNGIWGAYAGGIVGENNGKIANCYNTASLLLKRNITSAGNIAGGSGNNISSCFYLENCITIESNTFTTPNTYGTSKTSAELKTKSTFTSSNWDFDNVWNIDTSSSINDGYPYLRVFEEYSITYKANNGTDESAMKFYLKSQNSVQILGNEFGFTNVGKSFGGWQIVGDESGTIYSGGETITLSGNIVLQAVWVDICQVDFNINTNVGVVFIISDGQGYTQQIFVDKVNSYNDSEPTFILSLTPNKTYTVVISTYYTTSINFADSTGQATSTIPNNQLLNGNVLTFTASENLIIRINLNAFVGNNGVII